MEAYCDHCATTPLDGERLQSALRFSFGLGNTPDQARWVGERVAELVRRRTAPRD